jgi:hypothetical protein
MRVYFFGCWNEPGHHLWGPGGRWLPRHEQSVFEGECNLDGTLAPRRMGRDRRRGAGSQDAGDTGIRKPRIIASATKHCRAI